jgi:hypothetical protein
MHVVYRHVYYITDNVLVELEYKTFRVAGFEVTEMGGMWGLSMTCSAVSHG